MRPKDRIVEVNGLRGDVLELVDEMKKPKAAAPLFWRGMLRAVQSSRDELFLCSVYVEYRGECCFLAAIVLLTVCLVDNEAVVPSTMEGSYEVRHNHNMTRTDQGLQGFGS